jgi:hypothetical protein
MKRTLVRYKIKPEQVQENARLIKQVFQELKAKSPDGARYVVLQLDDGTFVHFATVESTDGAHPITSLEAFRAFQSGIKERCMELPQSGDTTIVGNFGFGQRFDRLDDRFLHHVLAVDDRAGHARAVAMQLRPQFAKQPMERRALTN